MVGQDTLTDKYARWSLEMRWLWYMNPAHVKKGTKSAKLTLDNIIRLLISEETPA